MATRRTEIYSDKIEDGNMFMTMRDGIIQVGKSNEDGTRAIRFSGESEWSWAMEVHLRWQIDYKIGG